MTDGMNHLQHLSEMGNLSPSEVRFKNRVMRAVIDCQHWLPRLELLATGRVESSIKTTKQRDADEEDDSVLPSNIVADVKEIMVEMKEGVRDW